MAVDVPAGFAGRGEGNAVLDGDLVGIGTHGGPGGQKSHNAKVQQRHQPRATQSAAANHWPATSVPRVRIEKAWWPRVTKPSRTAPQAMWEANRSAHTIDVHSFRPRRPCPQATTVRRRRCSGHLSAMLAMPQPSSWPLLVAPLLPLSVACQTALSPNGSRARSHHSRGPGGVSMCRSNQCVAPCPGKAYVRSAD